MILECVHVTTQEEANEVLEFIGAWGHESMIKNNGECIIYLDDSGYDRLGRYEESEVYEKYNLITFEKFLEKYKQIKTNKQSMEKQMLEVLNKTYDNLHLRRTTVPLFMSSPGIGKTSIIQKFAKDKGIQMKKITLSQRMPNEVVGGMMPDIVSKTWETYDSNELQTLKDGDILFFDEVFNGTLNVLLLIIKNSI